MIKINTQHTTAKRIAEAHARALELFPDSSLADFCVFSLFLNNPRTFAETKPLVEKQIGRPVKFNKPLRGADIARIFTEMTNRYGRPGIFLALPTRH